MAAIKTKTSELGESRVRVDVEVEAAAVEQAVDRTASQLGRELKVPGFRKGKVPPAVVLRRIGRESVLDEAVRQSLPDWYEEAITDAHLTTVGEPSVDLSDLPDRGSPLAFSIEVGVRPVAKLSDYKGLEVGRRDAEVVPAEIDAEIERLRESTASLENVDKPAQEQNFVVIDFIGRIDGEPFEGGEARGYPLELGSGQLVEGFEDQLIGASADQQKEVTVTFPDDYGNEDLAGKEAVFDVTVREVKEKRLPEVDDDFAVEAGGFDTVDELREDIAKRLRERKEQMIEAEFREAVVDSAVSEAQIDVPHELVHAKAHEMWHDTARRLRARGLEPARYLQLTGKTEEELVHDAEPEAEKALKRESVLAAVVEAEGIEVSDDELMDSLRRATSTEDGATQSEKKLQRSLDRAKAEGRDEPLREDIAMRKAVDLMVEQAKPISIEQAKARDKLWTPEQGETEGDAPQKIWTPG